MALSALRTWFAPALLAGLLFLLAGSASAAEPRSPGSSPRKPGRAGRQDRNRAAARQRCGESQVLSSSMARRIPAYIA